LEAAVALGYDRHRGELSAGLGQASTADHRLRIMLPVFRSSADPVGGYVGSRIVESLRLTLEKLGGELLVVEANGLEDLWGNIPRGKVHGIVLRQVLPARWLRELQQHAPVVYAISHDVFPGIDCVYFNEFKAAAMIHDFLLSRGHRKIAWMGWDRANPLSRLGDEAYDLDSGIDRQAFNFTSARYGAHMALDMGVRDDLVDLQRILLPLPIDAATRTLDVEQAGQECAKRFLSLKVKPSAVVFPADDIALATLRELKKAGVRVPDELSVVAYFSSEAADRMKAMLTGVRLPSVQVGQIIPEIIQRRLTNPEAIYLSLMLEPELVDRGTVAVLLPEGARKT
jgi:DNA-binding LacI/PurR family transcriptional regulator